MFIDLVRYTMPFYAVIELNNVRQIVILERNSSRRQDSVILDNLKPLFSLKKRGSNMIRIKAIFTKENNDLPYILSNGTYNVSIKNEWSDYNVYSTHFYTNHNGISQLIVYKKLMETGWKFNKKDQTMNYKILFKELQKIFVFRELFEIYGSNFDNIIVYINPINEQEPWELISINEKTMNMSAIKRGKLSKTNQKVIFPNLYDSTKILISMLKLTEENYKYKLEKLKQKMAKIIKSINGEYISLVDLAIRKLFNKLEIYFE